MLCLKVIFFLNVPFKRVSNSSGMERTNALKYTKPPPSSPNTVMLSEILQIRGWMTVLDQ